jgi:hypothetical protein
LAVNNHFLISSACFIDWSGLISGNGYIIKGIEKFDDKDFILIKNVFRTVGDASSSHGDFTRRKKFNK